MASSSNVIAAAPSSSQGSSVRSRCSFSLIAPAWVLCRVTSSARKPTLVWASQRVTASFRYPHAPPWGPPGLQGDLCSPVELHGLQEHSLLHHGYHGLQGNLSTGTCSISCPSFSDLCVCRAISHTRSHFSPWLQLLRCSNFWPLKNLTYPEALPQSQMGSALARSRSILEPASIGSVGHGEPFPHPLPLRKPGHINPTERTILFFRPTGKWLQGSNGLSRYQYIKSSDGTINTRALSFFPNIFRKTKLLENTASILWPLHWLCISPKANFILPCITFRTIIWNTA